MPDEETDPTVAWVRWSGPPPGEWSAVYRGCTCPVEENTRGFGILHMARDWWVNRTCPLHAKKALGAKDVAYWPRGSG